MISRSRQPARPNQTSTISGRVFISGVGFVVVAAMWALIGWVRYSDGDSAVAAINAALFVAHLAVGVAILLRVRAVWSIGLLVAAAGMIATVPNAYYLPLFPSGVIALLLFLSRADLVRGSDRPAGP